MVILLMSGLAEAGGDWQQKVLYDLEVELNDSTHSLQGRAEITYINHSPDTLEHIWMHLWPNAYRDRHTALAQQKFRQGSTKMHFSPDSAFGGISLENVAADGREIDWRFRSEDTLDVAFFPLSEALAPGDSTVLSMDFEVQIPLVLSRLGRYGNHYELTQWYPKPAVYDAAGWHPMSYLDMGEFYSEWGDYRVRMTLPANYRVAATGVLQEAAEIAWRDSLAALGGQWVDSLELKKKERPEGMKSLGKTEPESSDSLKTLTWIQENVHDFAWFAGQPDAAERAGDGHLDLYPAAASGEFSVQQRLYPAVRGLFFRVVHGISLRPRDGGGRRFQCRRRDGIPDDHADQQQQSAVDAGIRHHARGGSQLVLRAQRQQRAASSLDGRGAEQLCGGPLLGGQIPRNWTFAHHIKTPLPYRALRYLLPGTDKHSTDQLQYLMSAGPRMDQAVDLHSEDYTPMNYGTIVYKKAAIVTRVLHGYLGDSLMTACWHAYFERWAYRHPQPGDMQKVFEDVSGEDLGWFFQGMLSETGYIDYALEDFQTEQKGMTYSTALQIRREGEARSALPIRLRGAAGEEKTVWLNPHELERAIVIETDFAVVDAELDPERYVPEIKRRNNRTRRGMSFGIMRFDLNPEDRYNLNAIPYLWYTAPDGIMPGLALRHGGPVPNDLFWEARAHWGTVTQSANYSLGASRKYYPAEGLERSYGAKTDGGRFFTSIRMVHGQMRRPLLFPDNKNSILLSLLYQDIHGLGEADGSYDYFDSSLYDIGRYALLGGEWKRERKETLSNSSQALSAALGYRQSGEIFGRVHGEAYHRIRMSRKASLRMTLFGGAVLGQAPAQQYYNPASNTDPGFENPMILSRAGDWYAPGQILSLAESWTLYGFKTGDLHAAGGGGSEYLAVAKIYGNIPKLESFSLHAGAAGRYLQGSGKTEYFASASLSFAAGPLQIVYTPYRMEAGTVQEDFRRIQIALDSRTFGIQLGI